MRSRDDQETFPASNGLIYDAVDHFHQPVDGYRYSSDSILLADFVEVMNVERAADLGAGCGIVGLCALEKRRAVGVSQFFFVERQPELLACLEQNIRLYQPRTQTRLLSQASDWRTLKAADLGGLLDYIMVNPPYFPKKSGRPSSHLGRESARREIYGDLSDLGGGLARLLRPGGRVAVVFPAGRGEELTACLDGHGFAVERSLVVRSAPCSKDRLILLESRLA